MRLRTGGERPVEGPSVSAGKAMYKEREPRSQHRLWNGKSAWPYARKAMLNRLRYKSQ